MNKLFYYRYIYARAHLFVHHFMLHSSVAQSCKIRIFDKEITLCIANRRFTLAFYVVNKLFSIYQTYLSFVGSYNDRIQTVHYYYYIEQIHQILMLFIGYVIYAFDSYEYSFRIIIKTFILFGSGGHGGDIAEVKNVKFRITTSFAMFRNQNTYIFLLQFVPDVHKIMISLILKLVRSHVCLVLSDLFICIKLLFVIIYVTATPRLYYSPEY